MPTSKPQIAFLAAAPVLLVLPVLVMLGISALGIAMDVGMMSQMEPAMNGDASAGFLGSSSHGFSSCSLSCLRSCRD